MSVPGSLILPIALGVPDNDGNPLSGGQVYAYAAGTSTPQDTYADAALEIPNANPVILDSSGRAVIYLAPLPYKLIIKDADGVTITTLDPYEDVGQAELAAGVADGSKDVADGYTCTSADRLVTINGTGGPDPAEIILPPASSRTKPLTIKNIGTTAVSVTPQGTDTLEGANASYALPAASGTDRPTIELLADNDNEDWHINGSHKVP